MMRQRVYIWMACLGLMACSSEHEAPAPMPDTAMAISFGIEGTGEESGDSRADCTLIEGKDDANFRAHGFSVFGHHSEDKSDLANNPWVDVFQDVEVTYDGQLTGWNYSPLRYWLPTGDYEFRGFWPSEATVMGTASTESLVLEYSALSDYSDLMVGYYACETGNPDAYGNNSYVPLTFYHSLAAVRLKLTTGVVTFSPEEIANNKSVTYHVKEAYFTSLYTLGALYFNEDLTYPNPPIWKMNGDPSGEDCWKCYNRAADDEFGTTKVRQWSGNEEIPLTTDASDMKYLELPYQLMIPQSLILPVGSTAAKPGLRVKIDVTWTQTIEGVTTSEVSEEEIVLEIPTTTIDKWEPSKRYSYVIQVQPNEVVLSVVSTEWDEVDAVAPDIEL